MILNVLKTPTTQVYYELLELLEDVLTPTGIERKINEGAENSACYVCVFYNVLVKDGSVL